MSAMANRPKRGLDPDSAFKKWTGTETFALLVELAGVAEPPSTGRAHAIMRDAEKLRDYQKLRAAAEEALTEKLTEAQIIASGIPEGGSGRIPIDPSLWDILEIDYEFWQAIGEHHKFEKLEFFELSAVPVNIRATPKWLDDLLGEQGYSHFRHTKDYRHIWLHGIRYDLSPLWAAIVRVLHDARREDGYGWCNGKRTLGLAGTTQTKMSDVLKTRSDSESIIESDRRGMYRLAIDLQPRDPSEA
jgi:hypothetical protein